MYGWVNQVENSLKALDLQHSETRVKAISPHVPDVLHHTQQPPDKVTATSNSVNQHLLLYFLAKINVFILILILR